jgi:acyl transferase domain-containing protein/NADP-dependent 3-hydroxy acid dehydrogenase YdfG/acyl carrier protein
MTDSLDNAVCIVGLGAIMPDAPDAAAFWRNVTTGRYSISDVDPARWDPALYYDPDPHQPEKTYSKIGGWVRDWEWNPLGWKLPIPPKVSDGMDDAHKWAVACTRMALADAGWPDRPLNLDRTATIIGNALSGEKHYLTTLRITFPELARELEHATSFAALPTDVRAAIERELHLNMDAWLPEVTEDTMPGELSNCVAGRIANLFNLRGPNFTVDAACASALAAMDAAVEGLTNREFDVAITGGVDRNMGASTFVKFCAIGALSGTGTRPYADGADGFVMGEGAAVFIVKRLADAVRDDDRIYAVVRGIGGASDGKGKGITAPNPVGQRLAVERGWKNAGLSPAECTLIEGHGTSTRVGDVAEVTSLMEAFSGAHLAPGSVALGSVKSNIGHLKAAAGAAGMLKATLALHEKVLPASINFERPNPNLDWTASPFAVNTELRDWEVAADRTRVAGVSAFGFGGTNFHVVLEEHVPGRQMSNGRTSIAVTAEMGGRAAGVSAAAAGSGSELAGRASEVAADEDAKAPLRGALVLGAGDRAGLTARVRAVADAVSRGEEPPRRAPDVADLRAAERVAIDYGDAAELAQKAELTLRALDGDSPAAWSALAARGIFRGSGAPGKVAFMYTGQGSQYANMLGELRRREPVVADAFETADRVMAPLLDGRALSDLIFVDPDDAEAVAQAEADLRRTEITQPAVLAADMALTRLLGEYGISPDFVIGHSLGEYGALVAAGVLSFEAAIEAVSARGREMASLDTGDPGAMAAVSAPLSEIEEVLDEVDGYVVVANVNSTSQLVLGGATDAVKDAIARLGKRGYDATLLPVSHAFHTKIVAGVSEPLRATLRRLTLSPAQIPVVANVDGSFYPMGPGAQEQVVELLGRQVASPVQFVAGLRTLHEAGARVFVETGPKRALWGFAADVLGNDGVSLYTNHPKLGDLTSVNHALCGLYAAGLGVGRAATAPTAASTPRSPAGADTPKPLSDDTYRELGRMLAGVIERGQSLLGDGEAGLSEPVVITGAALGLPGCERMFDDANVARILHGQQLIDVIPSHLRHEILEHHITRVVKGEDGGAAFEAIDREGDVIKLAARAGALHLAEEFGVSDDRTLALGRETQLAIGAGIDALRDAGIPLVLRYRTTTTGSQLPDRWVLPESLRDDTGIVFASAFPGMDDFAGELNRYWADRARREKLEMLRPIQARLIEEDGAGTGLAEVQRRIHELELEVAAQPYEFDRRFLFRVLAMGHSQLAELICARGPNTQINAACASTTQAVALAQDWIRAGRARRVIVVAADDVTSEQLLPWIGSGFLASGAAATDGVVEEAALPFDRRRHGMLLGMGAAALVVESAASARERAITPICEVLGASTANSAFHGTRLDVEHIGQVMEDVVSQAERRGVRREEIASETMFVSHETYTPARGGSAAAEIHALRQVFGDQADRIVIANTKGFTGHPMGVGIEDVVAVKALETGIVPPVPNFRDVDPELGELNLSRGGVYQIRYALRLAAGFGSQISMTLLRWTPVADGRHRSPEELGFAYRIADRDAWSAWMRRVSGQEDPQLEVVTRTLRVVDAQTAARTQAAQTKPQPQAAQTKPQPQPAPAKPEPQRAPVPREPERSPQSAAAALVVEPAVAVLSPAPVVDAHAEVTERVLELVAAQTGYPTDLLDPDLDLEADLGIDTVKQAEVFAAIREAYSIERDESLKLRDYPTLRSVVGFVLDHSPQATPAAAPVTQAIPAPAAQEPAATQSAPAPGPEGEVTERVLELVAAQTGYPTDLLDPDLDLEADLGIDTVKQAEVFAAIREAYSIERDESLKLRDYPTLRSVVGFVLDHSPQATPAAAPATSEPAEPELQPEDGGDFPRRIPVPVMRPPLDCCVDTGVELAAGERVLLMPDRGGVATALASRLKERGLEVLTIDGKLEIQALEEQLAEWTTEKPVVGVYWLAALDDEGRIDELEPSAWRAGLHVRVKLLAVTMRALAGADTFLIAATRMGGRHGYDERGATSVMGGAVSGFCKALAREREDALVKVIDFERSRKTAALAELLTEETLRDPGAVEIGYSDGLRWTVGLLERDAAPASSSRLPADGTYVVTGAAGSIVSAITADLAAHAGGGTFHLLDLAPAPDPADPDLERLSSDRDGLARELAERLKAAGERPTPKLVERELGRIERAHDAQQAIAAIERSGARAVWHQVDLTDPDQVAAALAPVRELGAVDVLLHCAGIEISHYLPEKPQREYDLVFDVKADGWFNVLRALRGAELRTAAVFSSIAGRFGNAGQTDYSAANDLMCKSVSRLRADGATRAIAVDWTAWAQIGMASRGSIPKMMKLAGIDMLPPQVGVAALRSELEADGSGGEVMVAGALGVLEAERHPTGGLDPAAVVQRHGPMSGRIEAMTVGDGLRILTELDPARQRFLDHHRIDGTPVLPGVMGVEGFAEAAHALLPDWTVIAIEDIELLAPFKFYRDEPRALELRALVRDGGEGTLLADCCLLGRRALAGRGEQETLHFTGRVRLAREAPVAPSADAPPSEGVGVAHDDIYRVYFHGPAYQVLDRAYRHNGVLVGCMAADLPSDHDPPQEPTEIGPRLIELCFQTAGVWELGASGRMALPTHVDRVLRYSAERPGAMFALVRPRGDFGEPGTKVDADVVDERGRLLLRLEGYSTTALPGAIEPAALESIRLALGVPRLD